MIKMMKFYLKSGHKEIHSSLKNEFINKLKNND